MKFKYNSMDEFIAIQEFNRERAITLISAACAVASPEKGREIINKLTDAIFPEDGQSDINYMKKAKEFFEKVKGIEFRAT